ncbi:MAG: hypothetical protein P4L10_11215, partial [Acidobacteriaceae bacterium]|nr:hypothetical protein [Acidobacteriaceae bacterium]
MACTFAPVPVLVVTPVPPCATLSAVVRPESDVMSELAPLAALPASTPSARAVSAARFVVSVPSAPSARAVSANSAVCDAVPPVTSSVGVTICSGV